MNIFHLNLRYMIECGKLQRLADKYGYTHRLTLAQGRRVDKLHMQLQRGLAEWENRA